MKPTKVYVGIPAYGGLEPHGFAGFTSPSPQGNVPNMPQPFGTSILPYTFNWLLCQALNDHSSTHFALIHSDIEAPAGWVDTLLDEMQAAEADVISAMVPIKDARGLTSTGVLHPATGHIRRFTMKEYHALPKTFSVSDIGMGGKSLAINTGLLLLKLGDWCADFPGFDMDSRIDLAPNGEYVASFLPEDWKFSEWAHNYGLKVCATRAVPVVHHGVTGFTTKAPWGKWAIDEAFAETEAA